MMNPELTSGVELYHSRNAHDVPNNAIKSGLSPCGEVYVGVAAHNNMTMPCKIVPRDGKAYYPYFGAEHSTRDCTYLVTSPGYTYEWTPSARGNLPINSVRLGRASNGDQFAVGRVTINNERCVGKVVPGQKLCYVPKGGKEHQHQYYDVLVIKPPAISYPGVSELTEGTSLYYSSGPQDIPHNAVSSGVSPVGQIYVGYVQHSGETCPAKIIPSHRAAYYPYCGIEHSTSKFTFLVVNPGYTHEWVPSSNGQVPLHAAKLGRAANFESLYVGRVTIGEERCVGKILQSRGVCYIPHGGKEHEKRFYDALVVKRRRRGM